MPGVFVLETHDDLLKISYSQNYIILEVSDVYQNQEV